MKILSVKSSKRPYEVVIESDFSYLANKISEVFKGRLAVVYDSNTYQLFGKEIEKALTGFELSEIVFPAGESTKNAESYIKLLSFLAQNDFTRGDGILAVGGGVIGDLCGFVAATYMRGISYLACPTTLLSCVDSSIGGKTAINLPEGKNLVGAFYSPDLVYISLSALNSLPQREVECGMGEVVKYAFLDDSVTVEDIKNGVSEELILKCLMIKRAFVEGDEFDKGERAKLNLGHTVGHAVESLSGFEFSHGLCVAKGIDKVIDISCRYYGYGKQKEQELRSLLSVYPFDLGIGFNKDELLTKIKVDKKASKNAVSLVLIKDIGNTEVVKISIDKLRELL